MNGHNLNNPNAADPILIAELERLHQSNQPDADFAAALEAQLRSYHRLKVAEGAKSMNGSLRRLPIWKLAAAGFAVIFVMFLALEPLRSLAQDAWEFFTQHDSDEIDLPMGAGEDEIYDDLTLAEVEARIGFDVLEWTDPEYKLVQVGYNATQRTVNLVYEPLSRDRAGQDLVFFTQKFVGDSDLVLNEFDAVAPEAHVENVIVRGVSGEYVQGYWSGTDPDHPEHMMWDTNFHQLRWREGEVFYLMLTLAEDVSSSGEMIRIADTLK